MIDANLLYIERNKAKTLAEIGKQFGVTRERVRQILTRAFGGTEILTSFSTNQVSKLTGMCISSILNLCRTGKVVPVPYGHTVRFTIDNILEIKQMLICPNCGKRKKPSSHYCKVCWQKQYWKVWSPERKEQHRKRMAAYHRRKVNDNSKE